MVRTLIFIVFLFIVNAVFGQKTLSGPFCVTPGIEYQYVINIPGTTDWTICVSGGAIVGQNDPCFKGSSSSVIKIVWAKNVANSITVSGAVSEKYAIRTIDDFDAGLIMDSIIASHEKTLKVPTIYCTDAKGGACNVSLIYSWEMSDDQVIWIALKGETGQHLSFKELIKGPIYFRRKVTNALTSTVGYSNVAHVFVKPEVE